MILKTTLNGVSFIILSYVCYLHEARALLRRISRTGFLMTYNELMLQVFKKKVIDLPIYNNESLVYKSIFVEKGFKIMNPNLKTLSKCHRNSFNLRTPSFLTTFDKYTKL